MFFQKKKLENDGWNNLHRQVSAGGQLQENCLPSIFVQVQLLKFLHSFLGTGSEDIKVKLKDNEVKEDALASMSI